MRVDTLDFVYTLYVGVQAGNVATWVMHAWQKQSDGSERWFASFLDVSDSDPFKSRVTYDAWR